LIAELTRELFELLVREPFVRLEGVARTEFARLLGSQHIVEQESSANELPVPMSTAGAKI
jgi:hypothetical protein